MTTVNKLKLKPSVKKKWLAALRSGEYQQVQGTLRENNTLSDTPSFCCLGVLCNLHAEANPEFAKTQRNKDKYDGQGELPPMRVFEWAFTKSSNPKQAFRRIDNRKVYFGNEADRDSLADLNDDGGSFHDIADIIEKEL